MNMKNMAKTNSIFTKIFVGFTAFIFVTSPFRVQAFTYASNTQDYDYGNAYDYSYYGSNNVTDYYYGQSEGAYDYDWSDYNYDYGNAYDYNYDYGNAYDYNYDYSNAYDYNYDNVDVIEIDNQWVICTNSDGIIYERAIVNGVMSCDDELISNVGDTTVYTQYLMDEMNKLSSDYSFNN